MVDSASMVLPRGQKIVLQAEDQDYQRGIIVELTEEGGYKMYYWYGPNVDIYPVEVEVDGESIKPDAIEVYMKFHPELEEKTKVKQDSDIKGRKGTQPAKYHKGLSKSTKAKRDAQFKKQAKMSDKDPSAYKKAPGDARAKTKPSQYTKKFEKMFGEVKQTLNEQDKVTKALKNKAKKANAPLSALRAIYNKGIAAWKTGHRPGAGMHQWGMARVNSVLTGGKARKVDAAQWKKIQKHRKNKKKK